MTPLYGYDHWAPYFSLDNGSIEERELCTVNVTSLIRSASQQHELYLSSLICDRQSGTYKSKMTLIQVLPVLGEIQPKMASILGFSVLLLFSISFCPPTRAQMSSMSRSSVFPVRTFAFTSDTSLHFDLNLVIPIPLVGNVTVDIEVDLPLRVRFMNNSIAYKPIKIPYLILPDPKPITIDLRKPDYSYGNNYYSYNQDPYSYDSSSSAYYAPDDSSPYYDSSSSSSDGQTWIDANRRNLLFSSTKKTKKSPKSGKRLPAGKRTKKKSKKYSNKGGGGDGLHANRRSSNFTEAFQYYHRRHRRSVAESSAQHRLDLFTVFEETLNMYGLDGPACVCRAICEMAEMELLIESPVHEAIEHLLR